MQWPQDKASLIIPPIYNLYRLWKFGEDRCTTFWDIWWDVPIFAISSQELLGYWSELHQICTESSWSLACSIGSRTTKEQNKAEHRTDFCNLFTVWKCRSLWTSLSLSRRTLPWQPISCKPTMHEWHQLSQKTLNLSSRYFHHW